MNLTRIFAVPALLAALTAIGLVGALLGDGIWDALAWVGLGIPAVLGIRPLLLRR
ncbi:hypothetical protein TUM18999_06610 [Pseudomonas tohonis]|uniref:DUF4175 domain-containing protein n=1 Tax=Pseudomonas tohonis TaxID=2725477 RepID=A0A6J4DYI0_9PSED|nr:hypothetical protein [Pseudomonas tohonis]BCG22470.1 hypothetical protein TUM18999_06610 [Pseudomonas tohonis]GJN53564.1 hypothetical protein TUM20286_33160 [Pseudomonas tohonis]